MGCFPCFDSREAETLNPDKQKDHGKESHPAVASNISRLSSGADRLKSRSNVGTRRGSSSPKDVPDINIAAHTFTFRELAAATKNFRPESFIGEGGFGRVYKGWLESTGQEVAVKQLDRNGLQGNREFLVEVLMLSLLHHPNLVNLIGYCADGDQRLLVYEFMPLGSLEDHLHDLPPDKEPLDWNTRMKIASGAAKGLEYLHDKANPPVIYRDFKSSNILLDEGYHPKLSDFGLAKLGPTGDKSHVSTRVMGTYGYCAPEYAMTGQLTVKSDVYSFGVVFLELITGRKAIDSSRHAREQNLVSWARPLFNDRRKFGKLADPRLQGQFPMRGLYQALAVASMCIQEQAAARPLIGDVVTALSYLANQAYDPNSRLTGDEKRTRDERAGRILRNDDGAGSGRKWDFEGSEKDDSPKETARMLNRDLDRERAVAEAKLWGENWRDKRRQSAQGSSESSPPEVSKAYFRQFQDDFSLFLGSRSQELVAGGRMVLIFLGRIGASHADKGNSFLWELLSRSFAILVSQGEVEKEKVDSYEVHFYAASKDEIEEQVKREGSFEMERLETFEIGGEVEADGRNKILSYGTVVARTVRAIQESMIRHHFGEGISLDCLFKHYARLVDEEMAKHEIRPITCFLILRKR